MSNDSNETNTQSSSFREQILRELEERKSDESREEASTSLFQDFTSELHDTFVAKGVSSSATEGEHLVVETGDLEETLLVSQLSFAEVASNSSDSEIGDLEETIISRPASKKEGQQSSRRSSLSHLQKQEKTAKRIVKIVVTVVILALGITGFVGYSYLKSCLDPINANATANIQIEIPQGSSTHEIGQILVDNNLIKNASVFNYYAKLKSYTNFQSGYYNLNQSMSLEELAKHLQEPGAAQPQEPFIGKILIIEGYTIEQIAQAVTSNAYAKDKSAKTPFTSEEFIETVTNPEFISRMVTTYPTLFASLPSTDSGVKYQLEGYLFPATYEYSDTTTIEGLVEKMIAAMDANLQPYYSQLSNKGLDVNQLLTLASLVEKEGSTDEDRRTIASVFYNRINIGMPLQSNIAILYAMGKLGQKTTLAEDATIDTTIDSPYNIYVNTGLMPGPVASPSISAIEATLNPNKTEYYYFVADVITGTVYYSATVEEHNQHVETYVNSKLNN